MSVEFVDTNIVIYSLSKDTAKRRTALAVAESYGFSHYDSLIVAAVLDAGCSTLYSSE